MTKFVHLLFKESINSALRYLELRLLSLQNTDVSEYIMSTDYIGGYSEFSKSPAQKLGL